MRDIGLWDSIPRVRLSHLSSSVAERLSVAFFAKGLLWLLQSAVKDPGINKVVPRNFQITLCVLSGV